MAFNKGAELITLATDTVLMSPGNAASRVTARGSDVQTLCHPLRGRGDRSGLGLAGGSLEQKASPSQRGREENPFPHPGCDLGRSLRELGAQTYETSSGVASTNSI